MARSRASASGGVMGGSKGLQFGAPYLSFLSRLRTSTNSSAEGGRALSAHSSFKTDDVLEPFQRCRASGQGSKRAAASFCIFTGATIPGPHIAEQWPPIASPFRRSWTAIQRLGPPAGLQGGRGAAARALDRRARLLLHRPAAAPPRRRHVGRAVPSPLLTTAPRFKARAFKPGWRMLTRSGWGIGSCFLAFVCGGIRY